MPGEMERCELSRTSCVAVAAPEIVGLYLCTTSSVPNLIVGVRALGSGVCPDAAYTDPRSDALSTENEGTGASYS